MNKKELKLLLLYPKNPPVVVFEKADGTMRTMTATLHSDFITEVDRPKSTDNVSKPDVQRVYEPGVGWRSFRWDSVRMVNGVDFINND
jgi:hypothetical protein